MAKMMRQRRKGLSSVVGAVFMILVMVGAINVMLWTMQQQDRVTETIIEKSNSNLNKLNEDIDISNVRIDGDKLNMTVTNGGGAAATIKSIYIVNETANEQYRYDLDLIVDGRESLKDVGQSVPLIIKDDTEYSVRLITESGNTVTTNLTPLSSVALPMTMYVIPPTVRPGDNVTILFAVTNNLTDSTLGVDITPTLDIDLGCTAGPGCELTEHVTPTGVSLAEGNTMLFKWVYETDVPDETYITFNASLAGAKEGNYAIEVAYAKLIEESQISTSTTQVIYTSLVQKPEIFLIVPSPFGEEVNSGKGLWGVVVVNPTDVPMDVSRVIVAAGTVITDRTERIIDNNGSPCPRTAIEPSTASEWTCPEENLIQWKDTTNPEAIPAYGVKAFMARYEPGTLGGGGDDPAFLVSASVFSSFGQFTKTGYSTGMKDGGDVIANVFLTDTTVEATALTTGHMFGTRSFTSASQNVDIYVALADFDREGDFEIDAGTELIINVPAGFIVDTDIENNWSYVGFDEPTMEVFADDSTQIVASLTNNLGTVDAEAVKILKFRVDVPTITSTKVYIMHTLVRGETDPNAFSIGALGEFPLQVVPS